MSSVISVPIVSPGHTAKARTVSAAQPCPQGDIPTPTQQLSKPSLRGDANPDVSMVQTGSRRRPHLSVNTVKRESGCVRSGTPTLSATSSHQCSVKASPSPTTTTVFRDTSKAPVRMLLTQSVRKSNDRRCDTCHSRSSDFCHMF